MNKKTYKLNNYNLHVIKTNKFREVTIKIIFKRPMIKSELTLRNMVFNYLCYSSLKYKTNRELSIAKANHYSLEIFKINHKYGKVITSSLNAKILNEKYTEPTMLNQSILFFLNQVLEPNFIGKKAVPKTLNIVRETLRNYFITYQENKLDVSIDEMLKNTNEDIIHYKASGYIEDLDEITPGAIYNAYHDILTNDEIDIYIVGNIDAEEMKKIFSNNFVIKNKNNKYDDVYYQHQHFRDEPKAIVKEEQITQSHLAIGYKFKDLTEYEINYVTSLYNYILGNGVTSKLFRKVREEQSLCYHIGATFYRTFNFLIIYAGIDGSKYLETINLIKEIVAEMNNGHFTEEELNIAKIQYFNLLKSAKDNPLSMIQNDYGEKQMNLSSEKTRKKHIKNITSKDIINLANKATIDNIYMLKGVNHEEI